MAAIPEALERWRAAAPLGCGRGVWFEDGKWKRFEFRWFTPGLDPPRVQPQASTGAGLWG
jgi:hypothetical protein